MKEKETKLKKKDRPFVFTIQEASKTLAWS
jgi:hypothetical protein